MTIGPPCTDYILIAQDEPQIDYFIKQPSGDWLQKSVSGMEAEISIASVGCTLRLFYVYSNRDISAEVGNPGRRRNAE